MSKTTKRKHVTREVEEEFRLPNEDERIVKVVAGRGNNLHEVTDRVGTKFLVSMPTKFRKNVWIKRGDFVLVTDIPEGDKVKGEISTILYKDQIKYLKTEGVWPDAFSSSASIPPVTEALAKLKVNSNNNNNMLPPSSSDIDDDSDDEDDDDDLFRNTNRPAYDASSEESSSSGDEDENDDDGGASSGEDENDKSDKNAA